MSSRPDLVSVDSTIPSTSPFSSRPKRSACDRCRGQKLRCPPKSHHTDSCARCTRLGARCVTSYLQNSSSRNTRTLVRLPSKPLLSKPKHAAAAFSPVTYETEPLSIPEDNLDVFNYWPEGQLDCLFPDIMMTSDRTFINSENGDDDGALNSGEDSHDYFHPNSPSTLDIEGIPNMNSMGSKSRNVPDVGSISLDSSEVDIQHNISAIEETPSIVEWDHRLSTLSQNLSSRLHQCHALEVLQISDESPCSESISSTNGDIDLKMTASQQRREIPWNSKLFGAVLCDTSEFLAILQSYHSPSGSDSNNQLGSIVLLNILLSYLQIITIYNKLLQSLGKRLFESSSTSSPLATDDSGGDEMQILPGLQLAGFFVQQENLQTRILMDAMLHQFASIERSLGLPFEFQVTERPQKTDGKCSGKGTSLFENDQRAKDMLAAVDSNRRGLHALVSLKDMVRKLDVFLNTQR